MSTAQRSLYPDSVVNTPSYYSPTSSYPPKSASEYQTEEDDYKASYDEDIINSYALTDVPLPAHGRPQRPPGLEQKHNYSIDGTPIPDYRGTVYDRGGGDKGAFNSAAIKEKEPLRGCMQRILPDSMACRLYVLTVLVETITDIAIEADLLIQLRNTTGDTTKRLSVYLAIFGFAHLFQLIMACDAVYARNTLQFLFLTMFNAVFLVYAVIQIFEIRASLPAGTEGIGNISVNVLTTIIPIVISVAEIAYIALGWKIWSEFGWKVYKLLGADRRIKRMYARYQIFICLIKFDFFFFVGFTLQVILLVLDEGDWQFYVTCAAIPASFLVLIEGILAARKENKAMMIAFMFGCTGAMVYLGYELYKVIVFPGEFSGVQDTLITFAAIAMVFLIATIIMACIVMRNFNEGLKYHMRNSDKAQSQPGRGGNELGNRHSAYPMSVSQHRMSIE